MADESKRDEAKRQDDFQKQIAEAVKAAVKEAIPAAAAVAAEIAQGGRKEPQYVPTPPKDLHTTCPTCKLLKVACRGEHELLAVYPSNPRYGRAFRGIVLNGVTFLSNSMQHKIPVPKDNNFVHAIQEWERNEDEMSQGRIASHDSGSLGRGAQGFNPATHGWR